MKKFLVRVRSFLLFIGGMVLAVGVPLFLTLPRHGAALASIDSPERLRGVARVLEVLPALVALLGTIGLKLLGMHRKGTATIADREEQIIGLQAGNRVLREKVAELDKHPPLRATQVVKLVKEGVEAAHKGPGIPSEILEHLEHVAKYGPDVLRDALEKLENFRGLFDRAAVAASALQAYHGSRGTPSVVAEEKSQMIAQGVVGPPVTEEAKSVDVTPSVSTESSNG